LNYPFKLSISDYDYPLPAHRIAQFPLHQRDSSKLLVYRNGNITEDRFTGLANHLPSGSLMIFNETRVIHARLVFHKPSGSRIEIFCLEPVAPVSDVQLAFQQTGHCTWKCLVGNAKRWKTGKLTLTAEVAGRETVLSAEMKEKSRDSFLVEFSWTPGETVFSDILETFGKIPLPPYIGREAIESDNVTYQTVYARNDGSVAAPTAGLHFTPAVFEALSAKDIVRQNITLHVGAGTFKPVSADSLADHVMHSEQVIIPVPVIKNILQYKARHITVVGTTTVRSLESLYWQGVKWLRGEIVSPYLKVDQWDPYKPEYRGISLEESLRKVLDVLDKHGLYELKGYTSLLIAPGYKYQIPDAIVTNFHQPKSTLLLLVSAFIGDDWKKAYDYALGHDFRFLSYGDSCLFYPKT
jgi:S-adenosylmethionine:tRNA ribosyltransferase-isomerase